MAPTVTPARLPSVTAAGAASAVGRCSPSCGRSIVPIFSEITVYSLHARIACTHAVADPETAFRIACPSLAPSLRGVCARWSLNYVI
jgi:hypothetical protein